MEFLLTYIILAAGISLHSVIDIIWPTLKEALATTQDVEDSLLLENPKLTVFVSFIINFILAPLWIPVLLCNEFKVAAIIGFKAAIYDTKV